MSTTKGDVKKNLEQKAYNMRANALRMTTQAGSGHPTSALSAADLVAALFFYGMGYDPHNPHNPENDRFILSKGHASPILYAAWKEVGILSDKDLQGYREFDSVLEGHSTMRFEHTEAATGSLGIGLSIGAGMALYAKMFKKKYRTFVLLGDSEITEGSVWEAAEVAAFYKLDNLVALLDCNRLGQSTETIHGHHLDRYAAKFEAFGWKTIKVDGHDMMQIMHALDKAQEADDHPTIILAKTVKGYGVEEAENKEGFHGKAFKKEELPAILKRLKERFADVEAEKLSKDILFEEGRYGAWQKQFGKQEYRNMTSIPDDIINNEKTEEQESNGCLITELKDPHYELGEMMPTRKAYGQALTDL
ncbi:transketolase, partial [Candidatus Dependentiae bacterium]|nr:transketolase [Candidatus Dependentiae bacterium]